jgi:hemoglobin-like flavoprotein
MVGFEVGAFELDARTTTEAKVAPDTTSIFTDSLGRCLAESAFLDRFYDLFINSSPDIAKRFEQTNFEQQKHALSQSLYLMVMAMEGGEAAIEYLDRIARTHDRNNYDVRPELYDVWLECLICAAAETDPQFDEAIERSWRETLKYGIAFMRERY